MSIKPEPRILDKISGKKLKNPENLDKNKKLWYPLLRTFWQILSKIDFWRGEWSLGSALPNFEIFLLFPNSLNLKSFGNSWDKLCIKFTILHIKCCFTCGESKCHRNTENCQNILAKIVAFTHKACHFQCKHLDAVQIMKIMLKTTARTFHAITNNRWL